MSHSHIHFHIAIASLHLRGLKKGVSFRKHLLEEGFGNAQVCLVVLAVGWG